MLRSYGELTGTLPLILEENLAWQQVLLENSLRPFMHEAQRLAPCGKDTPNLNLRTFGLKLCTSLTRLTPTLPPRSGWVLSRHHPELLQTDLQPGGLLSSPVPHTNSYCMPGGHHYREESALPEGIPEIRT